MNFLSHWNTRGFPLPLQKHVKTLVHQVEEVVVEEVVAEEVVAEEVVVGEVEAPS